MKPQFIQSISRIASWAVLSVLLVGIVFRWVDERPTTVNAATSAVTEVSDAAQAIEEAQDQSTADQTPETHREFTNSLGMQFVYFPPGRYKMGIPDPGLHEQWDVPSHWVHLRKPFYIAVTETTRDEFEQVLGMVPGDQPTDEGEAARPEGNYPGDSPVDNVSWDEANEFCRGLSQLPDERQAGRVYRLPTEAEWEYVARSITTGTVAPEAVGFPAATGGESELVIEPIDAQDRQKTLPTQNMRGGVWEWCNDWYARDYYANSPLNDPTGPEKGVLKVIRNTPWAFSANAVCRINRYPMPPWHRCKYVGFRVVCFVQ